MRHPLIPILVRFALVLVIGLTVLPLTHTQAQTNSIPEPVLTAMAHLSVVLGQQVNAQNSFYNWSEEVFEDTSLRCPAEGQVYTQQTIRGYDIDIQFPLGGPLYNYRVSADSTIVILCLNGRPDPRSVGIVVPSGVSTPSTGVVSVPTTVKPLTAAQWYAWVYEIELDQLVLLNPSGEQARIQRPRLPNEDTTTTYSPQVAFSRDGRMAVIAARLQTGVEAVGLYSLATATFISVYQAALHEEIHLGSRFSAIVKSPYLFNPTSTQYIVGFASNFSETNRYWKVIVFDANTGNALYQLMNSSPLVTALASSIPATGDTGGNYFPLITYFSNDAAHIQLIPYGTEPGPTFDAINWQPNANQVTASPYIYATQDILPTNNLAVFPYENSAAGFLTADGPFTSFNAIAQATNAGADILWTDATKYHFDAKWAANGALVLFLTSDQQGIQLWNVLNLATRTVVVLPNNTFEVIGTPTGFLTVTSEGVVSVYLSTNPATGTILWQPVRPQQVELGWVTPTGSAFTLSEITLPGTVGGEVVCPNTPATRMKVGGRGQVSFTNGQPLRVRDLPNGNMLREIPEGTQFSVIGGPDCTGGRYTWYQIQLADGVIGWSAEGDLESYFMEPIN